MRTTPPLHFSADESLAANQLWRANCGPHSIAAVLGLNLERVRAQLVDFNGWMNPTNLGDTLRRLGAEYTLRKGLKTKDLCNGINRVQWEGSWLNPGVPAAAAYAHTHWVAHLDGWVLCTATSIAAWATREAWEADLVDAGRKWHVTHTTTVLAPSEADHAPPPPPLHHQPSRPPTIPRAPAQAPLPLAHHAARHLPGA